MGFWDSLLEKIGVGATLQLDVLIINIIFAVIILVIGILLGKFMSTILNRAIDRTKLDRDVKRSFLDLFVTVIKWSIYIIFLNLALNQIGIPQLTDWLISVLVVIPALTGALILIGIGFAVATYLKKVIEESRIEGWDVLSRSLFYFIFYFFLVFAIKTALIRQDKEFVNTILIIFTVGITAAVAYWNVKGKK